MVVFLLLASLRSGCIQVPHVHEAAPGTVLLLPDYEVLRRRPLTTREGERGASDLVRPVTQRLQLAIQKQLIARALSAEESFTPPLFVRLLTAFPPLARIPARLIGLGVRPEHVRMSAAAPARAPQGTKG